MEKTKLVGESRHFWYGPQTRFSDLVIFGEEVATDTKDYTVYLDDAIGLTVDQVVSRIRSQANGDFDIILGVKIKQDKGWWRSIEVYLLDGEPKRVKNEKNWYNNWHEVYELNGNKFYKYFWH